jgi:hypothetical protein
MARFLQRQFASDRLEVVHDKRLYEGRKAERVGWPG